MRALIIAFATVACTSDEDATEKKDVEDTGTFEEPTPTVPEFGFPEDRALVTIGTEQDGLDVPRDLAFDPHMEGQLWVVNRADDSTTTYIDAGTDAQESDHRSDAYSNHFMEEVSSLAFGAAESTPTAVPTFATCHESRNTYDGSSSPDNFMGPVLWPCDLDHYAEENQNNRKLGSHIDMLHESPYCMGIEWNGTGNQYWVFDGYHEALVYYDFQEDHGYGNDDHSDGIVRQYSDVVLTRLEDVPGHIARDPSTGLLYVADTGTGRVLTVDPSTAAEDSDLRQRMEAIDEYTEYLGATVAVFAEGLSEPSGLALHEGRLFVSDHATSEIVAYDLDGTELERVTIDADEIMGIDVSPDGEIWYVDAGANTVVRLAASGR